MHSLGQEQLTKPRWPGAPGRFRLDAVGDSGLLADEGLVLVGALGILPHEGRDRADC